MTGLDQLFEVVQIEDGSLRHFARHREMAGHPSRTRSMQRKGADAGQEQGSGQDARHLSKPSILMEFRIGAAGRGRMKAVAFNVRCAASADSDRRRAEAYG